MKRSELEHVIRAASAISKRTDFVVIGSQAILAEHPDAPADAVESMELDLYPRSAPQEAELIDGAIGEGSVFHETFGYYAHGVGPETAILPADWEGRLVPICGSETGGATAWCVVPRLESSGPPGRRLHPASFVALTRRSAPQDRLDRAPRWRANPFDRVFLPPRSQVPTNGLGSLSGDAEHRTQNFRDAAPKAHDLAISKLVAGREKDLRFLRRLIESDFVRPTVLWERLRSTELDGETRELCENRLSRVALAR